MPPMTTAADLLALRSVLALRRGALLARLATDAATVGLPILDPGFLRLLADTHTAIAALDAALAESTVTGGES
jgi:hypothetical protein